MPQQPTMRERLNHPYTLANGKVLDFWELAPRFRTNFAVDRIADYPRSFVWLIDRETKTFVHACVCWRTTDVLAASKRGAVSIGASTAA